MNQLIFGDIQTLNKVYKGRINNFKHKRLKKEKVKKQFSLDEINKFLIAKGYMKNINGQNTYILENLINAKGFNISLKDIHTDFKKNIKKIIKLKKCQSHINVIKEKIEIQSFSKRKNSKDLLLKYKDKLFFLNFKKKELIQKTFFYGEYLNLIK